MDSSTFFSLVERELQAARAKHPPIHSAHEGYAIILEEVDELKAEVWKNGSARDPEQMRRELIQIAAMCARMADDLDL